MKSVGLCETATLQLQGVICRTGTKTKVFGGKIQSDVGCLEWPNLRKSHFSAFGKNVYLVLFNPR